MVTKAIIENVQSNLATVRIPTLNKSYNAIGASNTSDLDTAPICSLPGISPRYQVGDIVFITFEDDNLGNPIIIGKLLSSNSDSVSDITTQSLEVSVDAILPKSTQIDEIKPEEIAKLKNISSNIEREISHLKAKIEEQEKLIKELKNSLNK